jgi:ankyrin repeat protein
LDRGADADAGEGGALLAALEYGRRAPVALLEARGAKKLTSAQLNNALLRVCQNQYEAALTAVDMLLDRGADANAHDGGVLLAALKFGDEAVVTLLEERGAKKPTFKQLNDALTEVHGCLSFNFREAIQLLIDRGADAGVILAKAECLT